MKIKTDSEIMLEALVLGAALLVIITIISALCNKASCQAEWEHSGIPYNWTLFGGCQLQIEGKLIPATAYRKVAVLSTTGKR